MVHYIRLLRTPQVVEVPKKGFTVTTVVTITTDLGDSFFGQECELTAALVDATRSGETLATHRAPWHAGDRACKLNLQVSPKLASRLVQLHVTTQDTRNAMTNLQIPPMLDVWSESFSLKQGARTDELVERRLKLTNKCVVRQWEETGDSIARHIWDASLGFLILFQQIFSSNGAQQLPTLGTQLLDKPTTRLRILELGAGCGIVGIALAQLRKAQVTLTDLEDAQDVLQSNVSVATPASGSNVQRQVLGWGPSIAVLAEPVFDLVLVSDCIYNPDSSLLLVETLVQISNHNPLVSILVGFKRRHSADDVFFSRMNTSRFSVVESCKIPLPHTMTDYDESEPEVEMFIYGAPGFAHAG